MCPSCLTVPQRPPSGVEEGAVKVIIVTVVGVVVLSNDVLQVGVLPVQIAGLDCPREHCPMRPRQRICKKQTHCLNLKTPTIVGLKNIDITIDSHYRQTVAVMMALVYYLKETFVCLYFL